MKNQFSQKKKILISLFLAVIMVTITATSGHGVISPINVEASTKPTISKKTRNILEGKKYNLNINNKIKKSTYKWTSSNEDIATVNSRGIVTAKSKGKVDITCTITTPDKTVYKETCKVTVREPAISFRIRNKVAALNLGQEYDLNRRLAPTSSNDKTTWTSSDTSIANPDSMGRFTALKEGEVTITGTTMSGKSDSVTIKVIDEEGIVTNQEELDALVGSGAELITIKTDEEIELDIVGFRAENQKLVVDAPNATIKNSTKFESIEIKQIKSDTWYEREVGNLLKILSQKARIVITAFASASIEVNEEDVVLRIENNGEIEELVINKKADIEITGDSDDVAAIVIDVPNIKIKTSVPLNIVSNEKFELEILPGGEKTTIVAKNKDTVPTIKGNANIKVTIGDEDEDVAGILVPTPTPGGGGGGGYIPGPSPVPSPTPKAGVYKLEKNLDQVETVVVEYEPLNFKFTVESEILDQLINFLENQDDTVDKWKASIDTIKTYGGIEVRVSGKEGETTKKVEFLNGLLEGRMFDATVNPDDNSVSLKGSSQEFTVKKLDNRSIQISPAPDKNDLKFAFTYKK